MDVMSQAYTLVSNTFRPSEVYFVAGLYYLAMVTIATWLLNLLERKGLEALI